MSDRTGKEDKKKENAPPDVDNSYGQTASPTAIGRFEKAGDAEKAVKALKQVGFSDEAISIRDFSTRKPGELKRQDAVPAGAMVGVQAEGERAAEAWSILQAVVDACADDISAEDIGLEGHEANDDEASAKQGLDVPIPANK